MDLMERHRGSQLGRRPRHFQRERDLIDYWKLPFEDGLAVITTASQVTCTPTSHVKTAAQQSIFPPSLIPQTPKNFVTLRSRKHGCQLHRRIFGNRIFRIEGLDAVNKIYPCATLSMPSTKAGIFPSFPHADFGRTTEELLKR